MIAFFQVRRDHGHQRSFCLDLIHVLSSSMNIRTIPTRTFSRCLSFIALLGFISVVGCGGPPTWVKEGSGYFNKEGSKSIYGVGSIIGVRNEPLAWEAAENRSRAELARTFETYTGYLMRDYAASTTAGDFTKATEEQDVERAIKTITTVTLHGVRPIDRYKDEESHAYYVLTKLSFLEMQQALEQARELSREARAYVKENAQRLFQELEKEEAKRE
ncbi:MAG: hypothetical protein MRJ96_14365 [Nitrospirales bacterium]|nr:hypothetical protein [Nitrospira sp.]MDR4502626.1 hypothetical protein [Nitrospirales bacterium]